MAQNIEQILILKDNWDFTIHPYASQPDSRSYFAGRKRELNFLTNEIKRNKNGSILVCGHRGVGKTSLVHKAIQELKREIQDGKTEYHDAIIVIVNCSQLEIKNEGDFEPKRLLKSLIKRLHYTVQRMDNIELEPEIKNKIEELYEKATASKFKLQKSNNQMNANSKTKENETILNLDKLDFLYIMFSFLLISPTIFSSVFPNTFVMKIISSLLLFVVPISAITLSHKRISLHKEKESSSEKTKKESEYDNSVGNLEYDLECLYKKIADSGIKILYVIDELDKQKKEFIEKIVNNFKNLFTLSEAQFIFISGQETYEKICMNCKEVREVKPVEYTYFTSNYFLSRPQMNDLMEFFDLITYNREAIKEKDLITFKKALIFEACSDFFDLKACIKNRITSFDENNRPIIELSDLTDEKNLTDEDIKKARFQQLISILFEERYMSTNPLKWSENELLQIEIYKHAYKIYNSRLLTEFEDPYDDSITSELITDFNTLLERCGAFSTLPSKSINNRNHTKDVKRYKYEGSIPKEPPINLSYFTIYEKRFMSSFKRYCNYVISLINAFEVIYNQEELDEKICFEQPDQIQKRIRKLNITLFNEFPQYLKIYNSGIEKNNLGAHHREVIEEMTTNIKLAIEALFTKIPKSLESILNKEYDLNNNRYNSKLVQKLYREFETNRTSNSIIQELNNFSYIEFPNDKGIFIGIDKKNQIKNFIGSAKDGFNENEILIVEINLNNEFFSKNLKIIETDSPKNLKETLVDFLENINEYMNKLHKNEI